jgi:hypothetical protein
VLRHRENDVYFSSPRCAGRRGAKARRESGFEQAKGLMSKRRKKKRGRRGQWYKRLTPEEETEQREIAFAAIRQLYAESLPLWRFCRRGHCRRHKKCNGEVRPCLKRCWAQTPEPQQNLAWHQVIAGGPRHIAPATHLERALRAYPPSNFVH